MSAQYEEAVAGWKKVISEADCAIVRSQVEFKHIVRLATKSYTEWVFPMPGESLGNLLREMRSKKAELEHDFDLIELGIHPTIRGCLGIERESDRQKQVIEAQRANWVKSWYAEIARLKQYR